MDGGAGGGEGWGGGGRDQGAPSSDQMQAFFVWLEVRLSDHSHNGEASNPD